MVTNNRHRDKAEANEDERQGLVDVIRSSIESIAARDLILDELRRSPQHTAALVEQSFAEQLKGQNAALIGQIRAMLKRGSRVQIGIVNADADGKILSINQDVLDLTGHAAGDFLGRKAHEMPAQIIRDDTGKPLAPSEHPAQIVIRTKKPVRSAVLGVFNPQAQNWRWLIVDATPVFSQEAPDDLDRIILTMLDAGQVLRVTAPIPSPTLSSVNAN